MSNQPTTINSLEEAIRFIREFDDGVAERTLQGVNDGEFLFSFNSEDECWELRGDYVTLLTLARDGEIWVSPGLLE